LEQQAASRSSGRLSCNVGSWEDNRLHSTLVEDGFAAVIVDALVTAWGRALGESLATLIS
jgi:hypothetical protein